MTYDYCYGEGNTIRFAINYGGVQHDDTVTYFEVLDMKW